MMSNQLDFLFGDEDGDEDDEIEIVLDPTCYCQTCKVDVPRQEWGMHLRTQEHKDKRREALDQRPTGVLCAGCPHLIEDEEHDDVRCAIGFWARKTHLVASFTETLWGYYNPTTKEVIRYYPIGEYDNNFDWDVCAVRPECCMKTK